MTNEQLAEIRARAEAATDGAFVAVDSGYSWYVKWAGHVVAREMCEGDATLFANARHDVLALLAEIDRLRHMLGPS